MSLKKHEKDGTGEILEKQPPKCLSEKWFASSTSVAHQFCLAVRFLRYEIEKGLRAV